MKRLHTLGVVFFATAALGVVSAATASAHVWSVEGAKEELLEAKPAKTVGLLLLHHKGGVGGTLTFRCEGSFDGTVGPGAADLIEKALNTAGIEVTRAKPLSCTAQESTNAFCPNGTVGSVFPENLPWATEILEFNSIVYDHLFPEPGGGEPAYEVTCAGIKILCHGLDRSRWTGNKATEFGVTGAKFEFLGEVSATCNDGGTGTVLGLGIAVGYEVL